MINCKSPPPRVVASGTSMTQLKFGPTPVAPTSTETRTDPTVAVTTVSGQLAAVKVAAPAT